MWFLEVNQNQVDPFLSNILIFILYSELRSLQVYLLALYKTLSNPCETDSLFLSMIMTLEKVKQTSFSRLNTSPLTQSNKCEKTAGDLYLS